MTHASHPYVDRPGWAYWKTGVAERGAEGFVGLWQPRFPMDRATRFATAGSCFAQRISRWLQGAGYRWLDSEPAPPGLGPEAIADGGWGVFSLRTGNIYSPALLHQWLRWAVGGERPSDEVWQDAGRSVDPFRPNIPLSGLDSDEAVLAARQHSLQAMRDTLAATDVFVFTLGLTEAWMNARGEVYPMCPGTLRGRFEPGRHRFVNLGHDEVLAHLEASLALLRRVNPAMRLLLTVSPVPLTATASDAHVLAATTWSKSVLRAAAGEMVRRHAEVDYFPSYELIAGVHSRGAWFEPNLRGVTRAGVDHVMAHFERGLSGTSLGPWVAPTGAAGAGSTPARAAVRAAPDAARADGEGADDAELVCEEERLNGWAAANDDPARAEWCLLGDSHMNFLSRALGRAGVPHSGGMVMIGSEWCKNRFHPDEEEFLVPLAKADSRQRWRRMQPFFSDGTRLRAGEGRRVLTNLGVQSHAVVPAFHAWAQREAERGEVSIEQAVGFYRRQHAPRLALLERLLRHGYRVHVLTDPPTAEKVESNRPLLPAFEAYEEVAAHVLGEMGCELIRARALLAPEGTPARYFKQTPTHTGMNDWIHGSDAYYDDLAAVLVRRAPDTCRAAA